MNELPHFLDPSLKKKSFFDGEKEKGGSLTRVSTFDVEKDIGSDIPNGYVLKEYKFPIFEKSDINKSHTLKLWFGVENVDSVDNLQTVAKILKERQKQAKKYFSDVLPQFVEVSHFVIGEDENSRPKIYEIQKRVEGKLLGEFWSEIIYELSYSQLDNLEKEVISLLDKIAVMDEDPHYSSSLLDLSSDNIMVSKDGHLILLDTNVEVGLGDDSPYVKKIGERRKIVEENLLDIVSNIHSFKKFAA